MRQQQFSCQSKKYAVDFRVHGTASYIDYPNILMKDKDVEGKLIPQNTINILIMVNRMPTLAACFAPL